MAASFDEALEAVLFLPQSERLLIGRGVDLEQIDWVAGSIDAVDLLVCNQDPQLERELCKRVSAFKTGESQTAMIMLTSNRTAMVIVMVLGPKSVDSVADLMQRCAEQLASHYVSGYLARKGEAWKRPLARVLSFRRRTPAG